MTPREIQFLYDYDQWADLKLLEVIAKVTPDQYKKDLGSSFVGIHGTCVHILSANRVWLCRWRGMTPAPMKAEEYPTVEVVKKQWDMYHHEIGNFIKSLSEDTLKEPVSYTDFKGNASTQVLCDQMQHKVNHSTYHRGQIITLLRQLGAAVVSTDMITYIRQKETRG